MKRVALTSYEFAFENIEWPRPSQSHYGGDAVDSLAVDT